MRAAPPLRASLRCSGVALASRLWSEAEYVMSRAANRASSPCDSHPASPKSVLCGLGGSCVSSDARE